MPRSECFPATTQRRTSDRIPEEKVDDIALRLTPLPKRMEVSGESLVNPAELVISAPGGNIWSERAAAELSFFIRSETGITPKIVKERPDARCPKPCVILLSEQERMLFPDQFQEPFFDDLNLNPGFQAYRMKCLVGGNRIFIQGLAEEGVYWGMKTLKQLMVVSKRSILIPRVMIVDGADMEERGIWTIALDVKATPYKTPAQAEKHLRERIDWMSDHKLNLLEMYGTNVVTGQGLVFKSKKYPSLACEDVETTEYLTRRLIRYGEERGVRMIPSVVHAECLTFISKRFPELKASNATSHHGHPVSPAINYFHEKAAAILKDITEEMVQAFNPRGICFWLTENRLHPLTGAGQKESYFMREVQVFSAAAEHARKTVKPNLDYRILLSQGSYPENSRLIHSLPKEVRWIFYAGERYGTYTMRPINPIPAHIAQAAQEGYSISFCNTMTGAVAHPTVFQVLHTNIGHAIRAGLKAVEGMSFAFPADRQAFFIAAQDTWNYAGRSLNGSLEAYAFDLRAADVCSQARAYCLMDQANYAQTVRDAIQVGHPFGNFSRFFSMLERIKKNEKVDELIMRMVDTMEVDDIPALSKAVTDLEKAFQMIDAKADRIGYLRCHYLLCLVRISRDIARAFYINCREKSWDLYKGPWTDFRQEIKLLIEDIAYQAGQSTSSFNELVKLEKWGDWGSGSWSAGCKNPLLKTAAFAKSIKPSGITSSREM